MPLVAMAPANVLLTLVLRTGTRTCNQKGGAQAGAACLLKRSTFRLGVPIPEHRGSWREYTMDVEE